MSNTIPNDSAQPIDKNRGRESNRQVWQTIREKVDAGFSTFLLFFSVTVFIATIVWVVCAAIVWPAENSKYNRNVIQVDENRHLEIWGPQIVPGGKEFIEIRFTLRQINVSPEAISLEMILPPQFIVVAPRNQINSQKIELEFDGTLDEEICTIRIANAHIVDYLGANALTITVHQKSPTVKNLGHFMLAPEGTHRAVLLRYGGGGNEIPFFPLTTLFISVASFVYQRLEREKQEAEKKLNQQKNAAEAGMLDLRNAFKNKKPNIAKDNLHKLLQNDTRVHLKENDLQAAQNLLEIAGGNMENVSHDLPGGWPSETAGVLLFVAENSPKDRKKLGEMLREFPLDKIEDKTVRDALISIKGLVGVETPVQARESNHPSKMDFPEFDTPLAGFKDNPFPFEAAEEDISYLFAENVGMFWSEHPLAKILKSTQGATLVIGEAGSGKTALAQALGNYRHVFNQTDTFSCYLCGTPSMEEIQHTLAVRLLDFVERLPSFLILLGDEQRNLLAQTLAFKLGRHNVAGRLERASNPVLWTWLDKAGDDEVKRKVWRAETSTHLRMLVDVVRTTSTLLFDDRQWLLAFMTCVQSLNFNNNAYLVIDMMDGFNNDWYGNVILANQHRWTDLNLHTIAFCLPVSSRKAKQHTHGIKHFKLQWDDSQLQDMANWRWDSIYEKKLGGLASLFAPKTFEALIKTSENNPRCLICLWNALVNFKKKMPFNLKDVEQVKEKISCV